MYFYFDRYEIKLTNQFLEIELNKIIKTEDRNLRHINADEKFVKSSFPGIINRFDLRI